MKISFEKYHGAGNDFILIDNINSSIGLDEKSVAQLCDRHLGIGADGVILIQEKESCDFEMIYYNADGGLGSMCGNGGRCAVIFARKLGMIDREATFVAYDGIHRAIVKEDTTVKLSLLPVQGVKQDSNGDYILNTGSPHLVKFIQNINKLDVFTEGRAIRNNENYKKEGINVNFVAAEKDAISMRTYERGVENETLSCGTGTVAVAMALAVKENKMNRHEYTINAPGGILKVYFHRKDENSFEDVWLEGPVEFVFSGDIEI